MFRLRRICSGVLLVCVLTAGAAKAQVVVPDGKWASHNDYLLGTWIWERQEPRQTMTMRFARNGVFFYENFTLDLIHHGTWSADAQGLHVTLTRSCGKKGKECSTREPVTRFDWPFKPISAKEFDANGEHWIRTSKD